MVISNRGFGLVGFDVVVVAAEVVFTGTAVVVVVAAARVVSASFEEALVVSEAFEGSGILLLVRSAIHSR